MERRGYRVALAAPWPSRSSTRARRCEPLRAELAPPSAGCSTPARSSSGPRSRPSRREFAAYVGRGHAIGVANGTEALTIALRALGVGPGDEVVVPSFTFYASAEAIPPTGARPVFCDVDPETFGVTPGDRARGAHAADEGRRSPSTCSATSRRCARSRRSGVPVVEDAAQAAGSTGPDGRPGALGTRRDVLLLPVEEPRRVRRRRRHHDARRRRWPSASRTLRFHGSRDKVTYEEVGYNSRLDELQAAILRVQLPHLDDWADHRAQVGALVRGGRAGRAGRAARADPGRRPGLAPLRGPQRARRRARGARCRPRASTRAPTTARRSTASRRWRDVRPPSRDAAGDRARPRATHLALPISAAITREQVAEVVGAVRRCASGST